MTGPADRRGFLRGLVSLPLIGGGVTLIGAPTAVAEPCTDALFGQYLGWLAREFTETLVEREERALNRHVARCAAEGHMIDPAHIANSMERCRNQWSWFTLPHFISGCPGPSANPPSTRAALVLATVGRDWREGVR